MIFEFVNIKINSTDENRSNFIENVDRNLIQELKFKDPIDLLFIYKFLSINVKNKMNIDRIKEFYDSSIKNIVEYIITNKKETLSKDIINEEYIPVKIFEKYRTIRLNSLTYFEIFLINNNVMDEVSYNKLSKTRKWIPYIWLIRRIYPKFCFKNIHPNNRKFYRTKNDAQIALDKCVKIIINNVGIRRFRKYTSDKKLKESHNIDKKIPPIHFDFYYSD